MEQGWYVSDFPGFRESYTEEAIFKNQVSKDEELFVKSGNETEVQRARDLKEFNAF